MPSTSPMPPRLAAAHAWARSRPWLARFTLANRLLLAMAFLPTGLVKLTGQRFTILPLDNPVGFFFEAMYRTGPYWIFIGFMQVLAAVLLLLPATATLGALLFLPIVVSILLITWGVGFGATTFIVAAMALSAVYLVCWDGDRVWAAGAAVLGRRQARPLLEGAHPVEIAGWALGGASGLAVWLTTRGFVPRGLVLPLLGVGAGAALLVVVGWVLGARRARGGGRRAGGGPAPAEPTAAGT